MSWSTVQAAPQRVTEMATTHACGTSTRSTFGIARLPESERLLYALSRLGGMFVMLVAVMRIAVYLIFTWYFLDGAVFITWLQGAGDR